MSTVTLSAPARRWVQQAEELGLHVDVDASRSGDVLQSITITIARPKVEEPANMLDVTLSAEFISIHLVRTFNEGRWTHHVRKHWYAGKPTPIAVSHVGHWIAGLAR